MLLRWRMRQLIRSGLLPGDPKSCLRSSSLILDIGSDSWWNCWLRAGDWNERQFHGQTTSGYNSEQYNGLQLQFKGLIFMIKPKCEHEADSLHNANIASTPERLMKHTKLSWSFHLVAVEVIKTLMKENREERREELCRVKYASGDGL